MIPEFEKNFPLVSWGCRVKSITLHFDQYSRLANLLNIFLGFRPKFRKLIWN